MSELLGVDSRVYVVVSNVPAVPPKFVAPVDGPVLHGEGTELVSAVGAMRETKYGTLAVAMGVALS